MKLRELLAGVPICAGSADLEMEISGVSYDSRTTRPGDLFVAMTGFATDGHQYIAKALANGAAAVLCQRRPAEACWRRTPAPITRKTRSGSTGSPLREWKSVFLWTEPG